MGALWLSLGSFGNTLFLGVRPWGRLVQSGSLYSFGYTLGVVRFIRLRPVGRRVHSGSLGSFGCALEVDGFIGSRWVHWRSLGTFGFVLEFVASIRGHWVHSGAPWESSGTFGVLGLIQVRPWGRWVHSALLLSFGCALGVVRFSRLLWFHSYAPWVSSRVHSGSLRSFKRAVGFIQGARWGAFGVVVHFLCAVRFILGGLVDSGAPLVSSGSSLRSFECVVDIVRFIRGLWVH